ncbi:MAG: cupin domain-containing protein [Solirubrobacteraceae bacterium]
MSANIYGSEWERTVEHGSYGLRGTRVGALAGARELGAGLYELPPGCKNLPFHAHHGIEEMIIVLRGTPTLRIPAGERLLQEGEVVALLAGPEGAHQLINRTEQPVRYLMLSTKAAADLIEYPDSGKISAQGGEWGTPSAVAYMLAGEPQLGYFDGEPE